MCCLGCLWNPEATDNHSTCVCLRQLLQVIQSSNRCQSSQASGHLQRTLWFFIFNSCSHPYPLQPSFPNVRRNNIWALHYEISVGHITNCQSPCRFRRECESFWDEPSCLKSDREASVICGTRPAVLTVSDLREISCKATEQWWFESVKWKTIFTTKLTLTF